MDSMTDLMFKSVASKSLFLYTRMYLESVFRNGAKDRAIRDFSKQFIKKNVTDPHVKVHEIKQVLRDFTLFEKRLESIVPIRSTAKEANYALRGLNLIPQPHKIILKENLQNASRFLKTYIYERVGHNRIENKHKVHKII